MTSNLEDGAKMTFVMTLDLVTDENDYPYKSEAQRRWTERIDTYPLKRIIDLTRI
ncbi:MAG: hypothetical protein WAM14_04450 [Candidatus Nitrosopolaris sp.]